MKSLDHHKILERITSLKNMQVSRGCTAAEADVAALKIGKLVQQYDLCVSFTPVSREDHGYHKMPERGSDDYYYGIVRVLRVTDKAILTLNSDNQELWIPRSQLRRGCEEWTVGDAGACYVSAWWVQRRGWKM